MRKALLITIVFLLLTLSITQSAIAQRQNIITNQTTEPLYVVYSTKFGAHDAIPAGYWTAGWEKISAGQQKTLWAYDPHKIYFQIWKGYQRVKPLSSTQTLAFWINRNADFNVVTQQEINASITRGQLVHSSHDTSALTHSDGFMRYNNGSQITVTNAWVNVDADVNAGLDSVTDRQVFVWDPVEILRGHTGAINALAWHPTNSQRLVSVSSDRTVRVWLFAEGITHTRLTGHTGAVLDVAWEQDGTEFHSTSSDGTILAWSPRTGFIEVKVKKTYPIVAISLKGALRLYTTEPEETSVDLSWDAKRAVIGFTDNTIQVTTVRPYNHLHTLTGHTGSVNAVVWSPDDMRIVSGSADRTVRVWDPQTGELLKTLRGHTGSVNTVAWSPDGTRIVSGSDDGTVRIWDADVGELLETLRRHTGAVNAVAWSPDGTRIASGGVDNIIRLWEKPGDSDMMSDGAEEVFDEEGFDSDMSDGDAQDVSQPVNIPDSNLRAALEKALGKTSGATITRSDMLTLTKFEAREQDIQDITGLEFATNLTVLNLNDNQISDVSPLDGLTELIKLFLNKNRISDVSSLAGLTNLTGLTLFYNEISDVSPLAGLTNLTGLYLGSNKISDVSSLAGLTNLIELTLSYNEISDVSPLAGLTRLTSLGIFSNEISDVSPLAGLTRLTSLGIFSNEISDVSPLAGLTRLKTLNLFSNEISDVSPLAGLTKLKWLDLSRNEISDFSPIAGLIPNLEYYSNSNQDVSQEEQPVVEDEGDDGPSDGFAEDPSQPVHIPDSNLRSAITLELLKDSPITAADMLTLTEFDPSYPGIQDLTGLEFAKNLTSLRLPSSELSTLTPLAGLTNLTELMIVGNELSDLRPLAGLTNLTELMIASNELSDLMPLAGLTNLTKLTILALGGELSDLTPLAGLTNLTELNVSDSRKLSDVSPLAGLRNLIKLDIRSNAISDVSPLAGLTNLTVLYLANNAISDVSPLAGLTNLTRLDLGRNEISDVSPLAGLTNLNTLSLQTNWISDFLPIAGLIPNLEGYSNSNQAVSADGSVIIPDVELRAAIEKALGKTSGATISPADMRTLTELDAREQDIQDITGIEFATNLTALYLNENEISDVSALIQLKELRTLWLYVNQISDIAALAQLTNLTSLSLSHNQLSDVSALADLKRLKTLWIDGNQISDIAALAQLTDMRELSLPDNQISDVSPLVELKNLTRLHLVNNHISDVSPLAGLTNLRGLYLSKNRISDFSPIAGLIPNLKDYSDSNQAVSADGSVIIPDVELRTAIEKALGKTSGATISPADMLKLTELSPVALGIQLLDGSRWGVKYLTGLEFAANLTELDLRYTEVSDVSPLAGLKNLETLFFAGTEVSDVSPLAGLTNLTVLYLANNAISDVSPLAGLTNLTRLDLGRNEISDISPLAGLKNLKTLGIGNRIADVSPLAGLKNLERLRLYKNRISDISPLAELKNLKRLDLRFNKISDVSPLAGLKNLERLDLRHNLIVDFSPIAGLISNLTEYVDKPQDIADENYWSFYTIYWPDPMYSIADLDWATDTYVICGGADTDGSGFLRNFNIHQGAIQYLTYKNDVIISVAIPQHDPSYVVYGRLRQDYASMRYIDDFSWRGRFGQDTMTAIEFANVPDAPHYLLTGGSKGVNTWDTENPQDIIHGEHWKTGGGIRALDPNALLIADGDNNVDDWDFSFGKIRAREEARQIDGFFEGIAHGFGELFAPEEKRNVVIKAVYDVHTEPVTSLSQLRYSYGNSSWFVSGSEDNTIRTWDKFNNKSISVGTAHKADVNSVDISPNGNFIASGSNDNTVCIWKCSDGDITELNSQFFADTDVLVVKFSPNGDYLAVGTKSGLYIYKNGRAVTPAPALITTSPEQTSLLHNYPNPFNPETWIPYHLSQPADVVLTIYSIDGKVVRWLDLGHQAAGYYQSKARAAYWDGRNNVGERVASGIYFYTLRVGDFAATKKLLIRK